MITYYRVLHPSKRRIFWIRAPTYEEAVELFKGCAAYRTETPQFPMSPVPPRDCPRWIRQKEGTGVWEEVGERVPDRQARGG